VMTQRALERVRRIELSLGVEPSHYESTRTPPDAGGVAGPDAGEVERIEA
jgi:hypothetical protein